MQHFIIRVLTLGWTKEMRCCVSESICRKKKQFIMNNVQKPLCSKRLNSHTLERMSLRYWELQWYQHTNQKRCWCLQWFSELFQMLERYPLQLMELPLHDSGITFEAWNWKSKRDKWNNMVTSIYSGKENSWLLRWTLPYRRQRHASTQIPS